ncbi:hypothetical 36.4 kDa protein (plasmid) [Sinorhizobium fredii NGR234]|uniref:Uncharacterized protein y4jT n=1 Tax=Sinorhizobium fredii (strain NBRC 101917 / NGR234) TaxID=394 RepID=Y4JT_SINFN|nr:DUF1353 domain-containing protein [Sinorhizobium fredii]P55520.1 RecName: Full=Uncharacterized protein y4jT; Flags: Precursor [Sinorhizobium fredii NGR234]pir/T47066/ hypothetical protein Y4jT [imported] - Rhizobium sp. (NGR234) plasmid pNGR234a [Rhizobium sp.]AAB91732.1 hypothetical 36.4 kDa protein [Sinorhizobium fredii NGR234]
MGSAWPAEIRKIAKISKRLLGATVILGFGVAEAQAAEFFGTFSSGPAGQFIDADPRPLFELSSDFSFDDPNGLKWPVPTGTRVDGASIPQTFWSIIGGPFEGAYLKASVIHDYFCETKSRTAHDTHRNFYYGMRANGVPGWKAKAMYWAVATYGPDWTLETKVVNELQCKPTPFGGRTCSSLPKMVTTTVEKQAINLEDPKALAVAVGKFNAIARNLKTSDGETLDLLPTGVVSGSLESIETNATNAREMFATSDYRLDPKLLGVILEPKQIKLDSIDAWPDGQIPSFTDVQAQGLPQTGGLVGGNGIVLSPAEFENFEQRLDLSPTDFTLPSKLE